MKDNTVILIIAALRAIATIIAILSATYLAYYDKHGWGWLIFLAIMLGSFSVKTKKENKKDEQTDTKK